MLGNDKALWLLFLVPVVLGPAFVWCFWHKLKALRIFASDRMLKKINDEVSIKKQLLKAFLLIASFVIIVIAITEPRWNPKSEKIKRQGRDVCFLLDTSRSMLAEDIRPNRLERAKILINDIVDSLGGDRAAIVTFAGNSTIKCPLTADYAFVKMALTDISTESTSLGGTMIGDAIRKAMLEVFDKQSREYKDIILITDGEEHKGYESFAVEAAAKAKEEGIRILAIGVGDETEGGRIPTSGMSGEKTFLKYNGQEVWSKLNSDLLREAANATGGKYLAFTPGKTFNPGQIYQSFSADAQKRELESMTMTRYDEKFQIFLVMGIILLAGEVFISERKKI
jgi:Ca-activated chloride channel family protein